jgi:hypothetical protein
VLDCMPFVFFIFSKTSLYHNFVAVVSALPLIFVIN